MEKTRRVFKMPLNEESWKSNRIFSFPPLLTKQLPLEAFPKKKKSSTFLSASNGVALVKCFKKMGRQTRNMTLSVQCNESSSIFRVSYALRISQPPRKVTETFTSNESRHAKRYYENIASGSMNFRFLVPVCITYKARLHRTRFSSSDIIYIST